MKGGADPMIGNLMRKIEETIEEEEYVKREATPPPFPPSWRPRPCDSCLGVDELDMLCRTLSRSPRAI